MATQIEKIEPPTTDPTGATLATTYERQNILLELLTARTPDYLGLGTTSSTMYTRREFELGVEVLTKRVLMFDVRRYLGIPGSVVDPTPIMTDGVINFHGEFYRVTVETPDFDPPSSGDPEIYPCILTFSPSNGVKFIPQSRLDRDLYVFSESGVYYDGGIKILRAGGLVSAGPNQTLNVAVQEKQELPLWPIESRVRFDTSDPSYGEENYGFNAQDRTGSDKYFSDKVAAQFIFMPYNLEHYFNEIYP